MAQYLAQIKEPFGLLNFGFSHLWTPAQFAFLSRMRQQGVRPITFKLPTWREFALYIPRGEELAYLEAVDCFICPNPEIQQRLTQTGIPVERTLLRTNGVPLARFKPAPIEHKLAIRRNLGLAADRLVFVFTGRFAARKRVGLLVEAFRQFPQADLMLVGYFDNRFDDGSALGQELPENVYIFGPMRDVLPYLQAADVFITASQAEGMSNALLEGMACGLPALASDIPGHREAVHPGENGWLFAPESLPELKAGLAWFIAQQPHLTRFSASARQTVQDHFDILQVAAQYDRLLQEGEV
jgi:glycosyltransferase involved in cell wall biosynthesis